MHNLCFVHSAVAYPCFRKGQASRAVPTRRAISVVAAPAPLYHHTQFIAPPFCCSEWVYAFLSDPEDPTMVSTGIQLSYSCITEASTSHVFNQIVSQSIHTAHCLVRGGEGIACLLGHAAGIAEFTCASNSHIHLPARFAPAAHQEPGKHDVSILRRLWHQRCDLTTCSRHQSGVCENRAFSGNNFECIDI